MSSYPHGSSAILPASVTGRGGYEPQVETCIRCQRDFELDPHNGRYYFSTDDQLGAITPTQTPEGWVCNEDEEEAAL
jgi:hypothetical protein